MESDVHLAQMLLLLACLRWWWRARKDFFAAGNLSIYYPVVSSQTGHAARKKLAFRGPDFFVVLGARPKPRRNSWVVENEDGKYPDVIVEVLSKRTQAKDRGEKKAIYEKSFCTPEYFLFDPDKLVLEGYRLSRGRYVAIAKDGMGRLWSERLKLGLGVHGDKLRFFDARGALVPLPEEDAQKAKAAAQKARGEAREAQAREAAAQQEARKAQQEAEKAQQEAQKAREEAARLRRRLRSLGVKI